MEEKFDQVTETEPQIIEENAGVIINSSNGNQSQIAGAVILAGLIIAGAILLKGNAPATGTPVVNTGSPTPTVGTVAPVTGADRILGNVNARVTVIMYEDFQCPFCGRFVKDSEELIRNSYVSNGSVKLVYRDYSFLGPESERSAEAARCAGDQGKFWQYHDFLFNHQAGENQGTFADPNLKSFASSLGLDTTAFNQCLDSKKYEKAVTDSTAEGNNAGVRGTPKGFIIRDGKVVDTIDGAIPSATVTTKLDAALK